MHVILGGVDPDFFLPSAQLCEQVARDRYEMKRTRNVSSLVQPSHCMTGVEPRCLQTPQTIYYVLSL